MKEIRNQVFPEERALYSETNIIVDHCEFKGSIEGESALKESSNIIVKNTLFDLRYPLWHVNDCKILSSHMTVNCRAPLWYSNNVIIDELQIDGVKALRECTNVNISNSNIVSNEFGWNNNNVNLSNIHIEGEYILFNTNELMISNIHLNGKYSLQYISNAKIDNSVFNTKDMLWHAKDVTIKDCTIKGEYLGWYSENITFINCHISGTQPLCYCKNLKLIDCTMDNADLSFEYSEVEGNILGHIDSIKNPIKGTIIVDSCGEVIKENNKYNSYANIIIKNKECA